MDDWKLPTFSDDEINAILNLERTARREKRRLWTSSLSSFLVLIASIMGVIALFTGARHVLYICAGITIIDSFIQLFCGQQQNLGTELLMVIIGGICALFGASFATAVSAALCIETAILTLISIPHLICTIKLLTR